MIVDQIAELPEWLHGKIRTDPDTGCWEWQAARTADGYGLVGPSRAAGGSRLAHRIVYVQLVGDIPADRPQLDHLCRVRHCVNPDHLEPVTNAENVRRGEGRNANKRACHRGHSFDQENTRIRKSGRRACRTCEQDRARNRWAATKDAAA